MNQQRNVVIIGVVALILISLAAGYRLYDKLKPNKAHMDLNEYYGASQSADDTVIVVLEDSNSTEKAIVENNDYYIEYKTLNEEISDKYYWDNINNYMLLTTPTELIKVLPESKEYTVNDETQTATNNIIISKNEKYYVALSFIKKYTNIECNEYTSPNRIVLKYNWGKEALVTYVTKDTPVRYEAKSQSEILEDCKKGDRLTVIEEEECLDNKFVRVITEKGVIGYVNTKYTNEKTTELEKNDANYPEYTAIHEGTVSLGWYMASNQAANNNYSTIMENVKGVNVIAPTWLGFENTAGDITDHCSHDFVDAAHEAGIDVWVVIDDFAENVAGLTIYSNTVSRQNMINKIVDKVIEYEADGVNVDFEYIKEESSPHYIQFIRELSIVCRQKGLVLSVDTYIPMSYNAFYKWADIAEVVDYLIIMGYDEYTKNSEEPGPVASLNWTRKAIENTLSYGVAKDKLVIGMPFYSRYWKVTGIEGNYNIIATETYGMSDSEKMLAEASATTAVDEKTGLSYAQYEVDGITNMFWLEDEKSIEERCKLITEAELAGAAYWRMGYEKPSVWNVITQYIK